MKTVFKNRGLQAAEEFIQKLKSFKEELKAHQSKLNNILHTNQKVIVFLSVGNRASRATVFTGSGNHIDSSWKNAADKALKYIKKTKSSIEWLKIDFVVNRKTVSIEEFLVLINSAKQNYFRYGISLDPNFNLAFLEQEVNGNAFIKIHKEYKKAHLSEQNMNHYCKLHRNLKGRINFDAVTSITLFDTIGFFYDGQLFELESSTLNNGRRKVGDLTKNEVLEILQNSSRFLANQVQEDGQFIYGYFSCFDKKINFYNILRHASSTYSIIEAYEVTRDDSLIGPIQMALGYLEKEAIAKFEGDDKEAFAYVVDQASEAEIKLGANAAAILALSKYTTVFNNEGYVPLMQMLANGIARMQNPNTGQFVHILNYPDLSIKEEFRIIYYDGEAAFALMRLYAIDQNPKWLEMVENAFAFFIQNDYWKHHDHWLSYCSNELTTYKPQDKYFLFGLENVKHRLNFMLERETTYPTFLELTTAAYKMVNKIKQLGKNQLLSNFDEKKLLEVIHHRAHYQLNGYFYPELAMYFKNPENCLSGFFIRHHSFRCRIDDIEHNLSGYCSYMTAVMEDS